MKRNPFSSRYPRFPVLVAMDNEIFEAETLPFSHISSVNAGLQDIFNVNVLSHFICTHAM